MFKEESGDIQSTRALQVLDSIKLVDDSEEGYDPYNTATYIQSPIED